MSPFLLPRAISPLTAPAGFPADVAPNQIIYASHINAIRDSVALWPGDVNAQNHYLVNVAAVGIGIISPIYKLQIVGGRATFAASSEAYGLMLKYNDTIDSLWIGGTSAQELQISTAGGLGKIWITQLGHLGIGAIPDSNTQFRVVGRAIFAASSEPYAIMLRYAPDSALLGYLGVSSAGNMQFSDAGGNPMAYFAASAAGNFIQKVPGFDPAGIPNGFLSMSLSGAGTTLYFFARGADGTLRSTTLTLA